MKTLKSFLILIFLLPIFANPIMIFYLNELFIDLSDPGNWKLELNSEMLGDMEGCYLTTMSDTAELKHTFIQGRQYIIITKDSLLTPLHISPTRDILELHLPDGYTIDKIAFGPVESSEIAAPKPYMSICRYNSLFPEWQEYYLYLDTSPTLGFPNDSTGAEGEWQGYVYNESGVPLEGVQVVYHSYYNPPNYEEIVSCVYTNADGYFIFENLAHQNRIEFRKEGYTQKDTICQIWPGNTISTTITMFSDGSSIGFENNIPATDYRLMQNFPNPFNAQTQFHFYLPLNDFVELDIFDLRGRLVHNLLSGYRTIGYHTVKWYADNVASGIYIYQLRTSETELYKKCILLK